MAVEILKTVLTLNTTEYDKSMKASKAQAADLAKSLGTKAGLAGALIFVTAESIKAAKEFSKFEKNLAKTNTILNISRKELINYGKELQDVSIRTGKSALEMSEGWYQAISAGVDLGNSMEFMSASADLAIAGFTTVDGAVDILTTTINAFGLKVTDATKISDIFIATQAEGKLTIDELSSAFSNIAPIASSVNIPLEQINASIATMTKNGAPAAQAVTQVRSALVELSREGSKADIAFQKLTGQSFPDFIKAGGDVGEALALLNKSAKDSGTSVNNLFSRIEAGQAAMTIGKNGAEGYNETLEVITDSAGTTARATSEMVNTLSGQTDRLSAAYQNLKISFGEVFGPSATVLVRELADTISVMVDGLNAFNEYMDDTNELQERTTKRARELHEANEEGINKVLMTKAKYIAQAQEEIAAEMKLEKIREDAAKRQEEQAQRVQNALIGTTDDTGGLSGGRGGVAPEVAGKTEADLKKEQLEDIANFNTLLLTQEIAFQEELAANKLLTSEQAKIETNAFYANQLAAQVKFYEDQGNMDKEALEAKKKLNALVLKETTKSAKKEGDVIVKKSQLEQDINRIAQKSTEDALRGLIRNGEVRLEEMAALAVEEIAIKALMAEGGVLMDAYTSFSEAASFASSLNFAAAANSTAQGVKSLGYAAAITAIAGGVSQGLVGGGSDSGGGTSSGDVDDGRTDEVIDEDLDKDEEEREYRVQGMEPLLLALDKEARGLYNHSLIATKNKRR